MPAGMQGSAAGDLHSLARVGLQSKAGHIAGHRQRDIGGGVVHVKAIGAANVDAIAAGSQARNQVVARGVRYDGGHGRGATEHGDGGPG